MRLHKIIYSLVEYDSGETLRQIIFTRIAIPHTMISVVDIRIPVMIRTGKSNKKPASAMGVQSTKKLHVKMETRPPCGKVICPA